MLLSCNVHQFVRKKYRPFPVIGFDLENVKVRLNKNNTYFLIFNINQKEELALFLKRTDIEVIYQGPPAVNLTHGHGHLPRNTLVVFEKKVKEKPEAQDAPKN